MKILEAQSATLTNYEVYTHLTEQRTRYSRKGIIGRRPGNLETVVKELLTYFSESPSPLAAKPLTYNERSIRKLLEGLRRWDFTKGEIIMIMNLRPTKPENLNTIVEELVDRFTDEEQYEIVNIITRVLGKPEGETERKAMTDNVRLTRKIQDEQTSADV
ncbi:hypothetical protein PZA11_000952 [Diplocarpon coronariae]|uniref:DNA-directed RNA polymerase III subunit RPC9 n=1 Tax=Diplocarpon coronariae TaxID=2795749 RepID=A0A218ZDB6_9HELO|nr:hypothetical protein JHW43_007402 [Diplocarpon mali]OWP05600.1 hypothetical protein B2J93_1649 [Marssonina coronariae]